MPTPDIFLSYSREDAARARRFAEALERLGFAVWWDARLRSGEEYDKVTEDALKAAKAVVVLWSPHSVDSRWVRAEATLAQRNKTLMPAMIEPCERPVMFELTHTAELVHWQGDHTDPAWLGFVADLRKMTGNDLASAPAAAPGQAQPAPRPARKRNLVIAFAALAVLALLGVLYVTFGGTAGGELIASQSEKRVPVLVRAFKASGTGDKDEKALAGGITDELIVRLRRTPELQIGTAKANGTAPSSVFEHAYVVDGNIQSDGNRLRVTARLAKADGEVLWSDTFDSKFNDLFEMQQLIASNIANVLRVPLNVGASSVAYGGTDNPEAYVAYVQGQIHLLDSDQSVPVGYFNRAIALDPNFVQANAGLASSYGNRLWNAATKQDAEQILKEMDVASARALNANPRLSTSNVARGYYYIFRKDLGSAETSIKLATELDPGIDPGIRDSLAQYAVFFGRSRKALAISQSNALIDPIYEDEPLKIFLLMMNGRYQESVDLFDRLAADDQRNLEVWAFHAFWARVLLGQEAQAIQSSKGSKLPNVVAAGEELRGFEQRGAFLEMDLPALRRWANETYGYAGQFPLANTALVASYRGHQRLAVDLMRLSTERPGDGVLFNLWHPAFAEARKTDAFVKLVIDLGLVKIWKQSGDWGDFCKPAGDTISCH